MKLVNKEIINNKKLCSICMSDSENNGIIIIGKYICEHCISQFTEIDCNDDIYDELKDRLKTNVLQKIIER